MRSRPFRPLSCTALLLACSLATAAPATGAAELRLGYIDSARIFVEYKDAAEAQQRFERQVQGWREEAAEKEKVVQQLRAEVRDQGPVLSALKRQEKESALQNAISTYEAFIQEIWGPSGKAATENDRSTRELIEKIRAVVEKIAGQKGLNVVLDAASGFLIYADKTLDLTTDVITELNAAASTPAGSR